MQYEKFSAAPGDLCAGGLSDNFEQWWTILRGKIVPFQFRRFQETLIFIDFY